MVESIVKFVYESIKEGPKKLILLGKTGEGAFYDTHRDIISNFWSNLTMMSPQNHDPISF